MATRTIVTSQPDVECDVCERRLLRGEQADVFIAAGRRRVVCELCAPRAVHEGWLRESDQQGLNLPPLAPRRGRSLLDRLRQAARPRTATAEEPLAAEPAAEGPQPYDFLDDAYGSAAAAPVPAVAHEHPLPVAGAPAEAPAVAPDALAFAVEAFNASGHARRTAGVARSLGTPEVSVRTAEHAGSVVEVVVAWELCWYRYRVDLDEQPVEVRLIAEGSELGDLPPEDRRANAVAGDGGALTLTA